MELEKYGNNDIRAAINALQNRKKKKIKSMKVDMVLSKSH